MTPVKGNDRYYGEFERIRKKCFVLETSIQVSVEVIVARAVRIIFPGTEIEFDRVEADHRQTRAAVIAGYNVTLLRIGINVNFLATLGTDSCRHGSLSPGK